MNDNTRPYKARIDDEYLDDQDFERKEWPSENSYISPIEHLCDYLTAGCFPWRSLNELEQLLLHVWALLPISMSVSFIDSMECRRR